MILKDVAYDFDDVLIVPKPTDLASRKEVVLTRSFVNKSMRIDNVVPIIAANMDGIGTFRVADVMIANKMMTAITKYHTPEDWKRETAYLQAKYGSDIWNHLIYTIGCSGQEFDVFLQLMTAGLKFKWLCVDVANGYQKRFGEFLYLVKQTLGDNVMLMAGNVCTPAGTRLLSDFGANLVKVGIGPGALCTTRIKTGIGIPQISAIHECSRGADAFIVADGGIRCPGDAAKAFVAGADMVMLGSFFAGTPQTGSDFHGMSSHKAQFLHGSEAKNYRASEGRTVTVPITDDLQTKINDLLGGLRSACTYTNSYTLPDLQYAELRVVHHQYNKWMERDC